MNLLLIAALLPLSQVRVNPDSALLQEFQSKVAGYLKLSKSAQSGAALKPTDSRTAIVDHTRELRERIIQARAGAVQGAIFTPPIAAEFRRLLAIAMEGHRGARVRKSLLHAEPSTGAVQVNTMFPSTVPLQSTPPTLLINLPALPQELDYRFVGRTLVLRDVQANLVLDFIPGAIQ